MHIEIEWNKKKKHRVAFSQLGFLCDLFSVLRAPSSSDVDFVDVSSECYTINEQMHRSATFLACFHFYFLNEIEMHLKSHNHFHDVHAK